MSRDQILDRFIAFDVETSGTVAGYNEILEISAVRFVDGKIEGVYTSLVKNTKPIPAGASAVNGIYEHMLIDAPSAEEALQKFAEFCAEDHMVAHNAPFDCNFISKACLQQDVSGPKGTAICSLAIARKVLPGLPNYKLGTLLKHFLIITGDLHRAEADSIGCGELLLKLMRSIEHSGEISLARLINLTGKEYNFPQIVKKPKQMGLF